MNVNVKMQNLAVPQQMAQFLEIFKLRDTMYPSFFDIQKHDSLMPSNIFRLFVKIVNNTTTTEPYSQIF